MVLRKRVSPFKFASERRDTQKGGGAGGRSEKGGVQSWRKLSKENKEMKN